MISSEPRFDPVGMVIDWLDACRERRLADLLELYAEHATLDCCDGSRFVGREGLLRYWPAKLRLAVDAAFELEEIFPEGERVRLDYRDFDGELVRTEFWFDRIGKISRTSCVPASRRRAKAA